GGDDVIWHIFTHSRNPEIMLSLNRLLTKHRIHLMDYGVNRGLAKSWNDGLIGAYSMRDVESVIIANDDIVANHDDLLVLANAAKEHRECGIIVCEGQNLRMNSYQILQFAIVGINPVALEQIGYFDENFSPIYYED